MNLTLYNSPIVTFYKTLNALKMLMDKIQRKIIQNETEGDKEVRPELKWIKTFNGFHCIFFYVQNIPDGGWCIARMKFKFMDF